MPGGGARAVERVQATALRAADHDGVTRIVIDLNAPVQFQVAGAADAVDVLLPGLDWRVPGWPGRRAVGLLRGFGYTAIDGERGILHLNFGQAVTVRASFLIPPPTVGSYRLVLDFGTSQAPLANERVAAGPVPPPAPPPASPPALRATPVAAPAVIPAALPIEPPAAARGRKPGHAGKPIVVLDPGHGGIDPGAISLSGAYEKNIVLALARDVKAQLDKGGKVTCLLTRDRDLFVALRDRVAISRAGHADLFLSLHADTVADPMIRGLSVYTLSQNASDAEAQALADKENKADIVAGIDLSNESPEVTNILIDLVQRESMNLSAVFAQKLIAAVSHETHILLQNTHRFAGFAVLKAPDIPSVLVETGYLSNETDEQMLRRPEYRAKLATALARAIEHFFAENWKARRK
ncbi:MAG TPA: N-acetylmuramoyl-L-alanine amidase [Rhodospirillaceae bacterium]|nr:N-acetylmuramoyl-L-alanine amidase [Rhodospirillaceae bacterium]